VFVSLRSVAFLGIESTVMATCLN